MKCQLKILLIYASYDLLIAEEVAILRGISLATEARLMSFVIESNALEVVNLINAGVPSSTNIGLVIGEIRGKAS
ncbi:hypothetical protein LWI28_024188 [Acer negundo]|uniref:RNase H type-1 domain-containing protein n=1 Tax=Acer negundo TaxID=4023 RepID=A0AAD5P094_ACENE|nr:hypothetical protein LWI28_024188 [Acer negundo]